MCVRSYVYRLRVYYYFIRDDLNRAYPSPHPLHRFSEARRQIKKFRFSLSGKMDSSGQAGTVGTPMEITQQLHMQRFCPENVAHNAKQLY